MQVNGTPFRSIWLAADKPEVLVIDQTLLPFAFGGDSPGTSETAHAIREMVVRGAPLIGATAACGLFLAAASDASEDNLRRACEELPSCAPPRLTCAGRSTERCLHCWTSPNRGVQVVPGELAQQICDEDVSTNSAIGDHGLALISEAANACPSRPVNILTHCNAGWLATVDWGTASRRSSKRMIRALQCMCGDETRPRNQGASLTAWELGAHGVSHTVIADNAGGHLMQHGEVDLCIVGSDRTTRAGDVCNKIGTYLKALAANDNGIPFTPPCHPPPSTGRFRMAFGISRSKSAPKRKSATSVATTVRRIGCGCESSPTAVQPPILPLTSHHANSYMALSKEAWVKACEDDLISLFRRMPKCKTYNLIHSHISRG